MAVCPDVIAWLWVWTAVEPFVTHVVVNVVKLVPEMGDPVPAGIEVMVLLPLKEGA